MTRRTWARNTQGLIASAGGRTSAAEGRASKALDELESEGATITFQSVAERGSVSSGFLYGRPALRQRVEAARARQTGRREIARVRHARTDAGLQVLLAAKERRIGELEGEVRELTRQLAICRGQLYDRMRPLTSD
jgi:Family of unknown function (DUF6262)